MILSGVLGLLMAFIAYGRMVLSRSTDRRGVSQRVKSGNRNVPVP